MGGGVGVAGGGFSGRRWRGVQGRREGGPRLHWRRHGQDLAAS